MSGVSKPEAMDSENTPFYSSQTEKSDDTSSKETTGKKNHLQVSDTTIDNITMNTCAGDKNVYEKDRGASKVQTPQSKGDAEATVNIDKVKMNNVNLNSGAGDVNIYKPGVAAQPTTAPRGSRSVTTVITGSTLKGGVINTCAGNTNTFE